MGWALLARCSGGVRGRGRSRTRRLSRDRSFARSLSRDRDSVRRLVDGHGHRDALAFSEGHERLDVRGRERPAFGVERHQGGGARRRASGTRVPTRLLSCVPEGPFFEASAPWDPGVGPRRRGGWRRPHGGRRGLPRGAARLRPFQRWQRTRRDNGQHTRTHTVSTTTRGRRRSPRSRRRGPRRDVPRAQA